MRNLANEIARMIEKALGAFRPKASSIDDQLQGSQVAPAGAGGSGSRGTVALSDATPAAVGTAAAGASGDASRGDHVHAHGNQAGGPLHPAATTSVAGFQSAADKAKEDAYPAISSLTIGHVLTATGATAVAFQAPATAGTVTSVGLALPAEFTITVTPITTAGTLTAVWAAVVANRVFAGPTSGGAATPAFRALVAADIPSLDTSKLTTGQLALARGGSGADLSATGGAGQVVKQATAGAALSVAALVASDIPTLTAAKISDFDTQVRTSRLDQMATAGANVSLGSHKITNVTDPTGPQDAATKAYVDAAAQGLDVKPSVRAASTTDLPLSGTAGVDGVSVIAGDRVLVKDQATASQNGIYIVAAGAWSRSTDTDTPAEMTPGMFTFVEEGAVNADSGWLLSSTPNTFVQFSGAGQITAGAGLTKSGNTLDVNVDGSTIEIASDIVRVKNGGVTYAKIQNVANGKLLGRTTAGAGVVEEVPLSTTAAASTVPLGASDNPLHTSWLMVSQDVGSSETLTIPTRRGLTVPRELAVAGRLVINGTLAVV